MELKGRLAVVTGASSGIGEATARLLARRGARVVLVARRKAELQAVASSIAASGGSAEAVVADLGDPACTETLEAAVTRGLGVPDLLVNNAGAGRWLFAEETPPTEAVAMMAAPYFAAFFATRAFLPAMLRRGSGHVVNVNSPVCRLTWPGAAGYAAARWALRGFTEALRQELRTTGIGVTHFVAGKTASGYFEHNPGSEDRIPRIARLIPTLTVERAAEALVAGVERDAPEVVVPGMLKLFWVLERPFPGLTSWLVFRTGARR